MRPAVGDRLTGPEPGQYLQLLVEHRRPHPGVRLLAAVVVFVRKGAAADTEHEPPRLRRSSVTVWRASTTGRWRGSGVTRVPSRMVEVAKAAAVSATHGSTTSIGPGPNGKTWSHRKKPSQPALSADAAQSATRRASRPCPKFGMLRPIRIRIRIRDTLDQTADQGRECECLPTRRRKLVLVACHHWTHCWSVRCPLCPPIGGHRDQPVHQGISGCRLRAADSKVGVIRERRTPHRHRRRKPCEHFPRQL